jgi:hypothetical protein
MNALTPAEMELMGAIAATAASRRFDTTTLILAAQTDQRMAAALDMLVPPRKYISPRRRSLKIRRILKAMADRNLFAVDYFGWWSLRPPVVSDIG